MMTDWEKWLDDNAVNRESAYYNGILYLFAELKDGWVAIFEVDRGRLYPMIQAVDMAKARSWCYMREPVTVPMERIC